MTTATETITDLERQSTAAAAEVADLERQADTAPASELSRLSAAIGSARALLDVTGRRHRAAVAREQAEQAAREQASQAASHAKQLADLKARKSAANAAWQKWGADAEALEAAAAELWQRWDTQQVETRSIAEEDLKLGANLPPVDPGAVTSAFVARCRGRNHALAFAPDVRAGRGPMSW